MDRFRLTSVPPGIPIGTRRAVQRVLRGTVPRVADFALAYVVDGDAATCIASAHVTRAGERLVRSLGHIHRVKKSDDVSAVAQVLRTSTPLLRKVIPADRRAAPPRAGLRGVDDLHQCLAPCSALVVPIMGARSIVGALSLCYSESGRSYTRGHIRVASQVAGEIGRLLSASASCHGTLRLRPPARDARQGTTVRRRVVPRD